jgi:hypothetical protein
MRGWKDFFCRIGKGVADFMRLLTFRRPLGPEARQPEPETEERPAPASKPGRLKGPPYAALRQ